METQRKLDLLGDSARWDVSAPGVALSEAMRQAEERLRQTAGCIFLAQARGGGCLPVFKVLMTNECRNRCHYCGLRASSNVPRAGFEPEELARTFMDLEGRGLVQGLFLSSGVREDAERAQQKMIEAVEILRRRYAYRGYVHLKILPGVSDAAIEASVRLASRVSVNLEAPTVGHLQVIAPDKHLREELLRPMERAAGLCASGLARSGLTTQFVVGGAGESDREILQSSDWLYRHYELRRAYYSSFRPVPNTPLSDVPPSPPVRELRLYQADALLTDYGFQVQEMPFGAGGELPAGADPKLATALAHPERYPVEVNTASREELLRVPGLGPKGVERVLAARREGVVRGPEALRRLGVRAGQTAGFLMFNGRHAGQRRLAL
jgi:predicted DNA-binding helix-hairpin-helix protein